MCRKLITLFCLAPLVSLSSPVRSSGGGLGMQFPRDTPDDPPLPSGAVAVAFLECTGTQYIDTMCFYEAEDVIDMDIVNTSNEDSSWSRGIGFCIQPSSDFEYAGLAIRAQPKYPGHLYINATRMAGVNVAFSLEGVFGESQHLHIESGNTWLDGCRSGREFGKDLLPCDLSILLFARHDFKNNAPRIYPFYCRGSRIRTFRLSRGGEILIDLVAVRIEDDSGSSVGCMYDFVSNDFLFNQGTGNLLIGPDL